MPDPADKPHYDPADPRIYFAAERTLLAWVRTGLAMMGFGFVVARSGVFLRMLAGGEVAAGTVDAAARATGAGAHGGFSLYVGTAMVGLGVAVNVAAAVQHVLTLRRLRRGTPIWQDRLSLAMVVAGVLALIGVAMVLYLASAL